MNKFTLSLVSLLACFAGQEVFAAYGNANAVSEFKLLPRASAWGMTGSYTLGQGQALVPFSGDQSRVFYGLVEGNVVAHDGTWFAGGGLGYRQIINDRIYGGYFTTDYTKSIGKNSFIIANPGVEIFGKTWDFNVNAYIPFYRARVLNQDGWAGDDFKNYAYLRLTGHNQYDHKLQEFEQVGSGLDFRVGRVVPRFDKAKVYLGGYYFTTKNAGDVKGAMAKLTYTLNRYAAVEFTSSYDNYNHSKNMLGIKLTLGGYSEQEKKDFGLSSRLLDTIDRGYSGANGTLVPVKKSYVDQGEFLQHDGVWFVKPGGTQSQNNGLKLGQSAGANAVAADVGTAENPMSLSKENFDFIAANFKPGQIDAAPLLYFATGAYSFSGFTGFDGAPSRLQLPMGWGIYGRSADYVRPAVGVERPTFVGGLDFGVETGGRGGNNVVDSVIVRANSGQTYFSFGIMQMFNARNVTLHNVKVGDDSFIDRGCSSGVWLYDSTVNLHDVDIRGARQQNYGFGDAVGILAMQGSVINFVEGTNTVTALGGGEMDVAVSIWLEGATVNFTGGINNIRTSSSIDSHGVDNMFCGIWARDNSAVNFIGGVNNVSMSNMTRVAPDVDTFYGIKAENSTIDFFGGKNTIMVFNSMSSNDYFRGWSYGVYADGSKVNFRGGANDIYVASNAKTASSKLASFTYGVSAANNSSISFQGGKNSINVLASGVTAISADLSQGSIFSVYGITVSDSQAVFSGGENYIASKNAAVGNSLHVVGISVYTSTALPTSFVDFAGGTNKIEVGISGKGTYLGANGIFVNKRSQLRKGGVEVETGQLQQVLGGVTLVRVPGVYGSGLMIERDGKDSLDW